MSNLFSGLNWITKYLEGSHLGKLPFTYLVYELLYTKLAPKGEEVLVSLDGHKLWVNSRDRGEVTTALLNRKEYFPFLTKIIEDNTPTGEVCVDVGAHIGFYTLMMARKASKVYAFEPAPYNYSLLLRNISINKYSNIIPSNKAVSDGVGISRLLLNKVDLEGNSLLSRKSLSTLGFKTLEIETTSLDSCINDKVDLVKIDVEGAEPLVLKGMQALIKENKSIVIILEFLPSALKKGKAPPKAFLEGILSLGLRIYNIDEEKRELYQVTPEYLLTSYKQGCTNLLLRRE